MGMSPAFTVPIIYLFSIIYTFFDKKEDFLVNDNTSPFNRFYQHLVPYNHFQN